MPKLLFRSGSGILPKSKGRSRIVAVAGVSPGIGTTHSVILMANYLRRQRLKVGVVELGTRGHLAQIEKAYEGMGFDSAATDRFRIKQVVYHKRVSKSRLMQLYRESYDVLILDMGADLSAYAEDFQLADLSIVTAQLSDWKQEEITTFIIAWDQLLDQRSCWLLPFAEGGEVREFERMHGQRGQGISFCHDPFVRDKAVDRQLKKLFE